MLTTFLKRLVRGADLDAEETTTAFGEIMDGQATPAQIAAFLIALRIKGETVEEISGAAVAMRQRMTPIVVDREPLIDTCGTGGDGASTFNISTTVAFVAAAGGAAVAKHGNRAVSSRSGSADVLAALGVNIEASVEVVQQCVNEIGLGFLFAPAHHPAMRNAAPVRQELGIRTIFNVLGPLTNPAGAKRQLLGVYDRKLTAPIAAVLGNLGSERAWVVHGADGLDEITVCEATVVAEWTGSKVVEHVIAPEDFGMRRSLVEGLKGGSPTENATILREVLSGGRAGAMQDAVALNAAAAFVVAGLSEDLQQGLERAREILQDGSATEVLERLIVISNGR